MDCGESPDSARSCSPRASRRATSGVGVSRSRAEDDLMRRNSRGALRADCAGALGLGKEPAETDFLVRGE